MKSVVTNRQIFFILILLLSTDVLADLPKTAAETAGTGAWLTIIMTAAVFASGVYMITRLNLKFEDKTVFEYSDILVGKPLAFLIKCFYSVYFLVVLILIFRDIATLIKNAFLPITPFWVLLLLFLSVAMYASYKSVTITGRLCEIIGVILLTVAFSTHAAMFFLGDTKYILPFFEMSEADKYIIGMKDMIYSFLGIEAIILLPLNKSVNKKAPMTAVFAILLLAVFYIVVVETSVMIVGMNDITSYDYSLIEALRETKLPDALLLERPDLLFLTVGIAAFIGGLSILSCVTIDSIHKLIAWPDRKVTLFIVGAVVLITVTFFMSDDLTEYIRSAIIPTSGIVAAFIIPLMLIIISKVRKI